MIDTGSWAVFARNAQGGFDAHFGPKSEKDAQAIADDLRTSQPQGLILVTMIATRSASI